MRAPCRGQCTSRRTRRFASDVTVWTERAWQFTLHDLDECPDRLHWEMQALKDQRLKTADQFIADRGLDPALVAEHIKLALQEHIEKGTL